MFEPLSRFTIRQRQRIRAPPGQFEHAAARFLRQSANGSARQQIAGLKVASIDGVMGELLRDAPVKILEIRARDRVGRGHGGGLQTRFQLDVVGEIFRGPQVGQGLGILRRERFSERFERLPRHDPGRDAPAENFRPERGGRVIFPGLQIARTPVIHQNEAENVIRGAIDRNWLAQGIARSDKERGFQLVIKAAARPENRRWRIGRLDLAMGPPHLRTTRDNRTGAAVIRNREPFPVGHECVLRTAQHRADVVRVVVGRVEIGVIANARRKLHRDIFLRVKDSRAERTVIAQGRSFGGEQILYYFPRLPPRRAPEGQKRVQRAFRENSPALKLRRSEMAKLLEHREIDHELANGDPNASAPLRRFKNTEGKILDGKMRIGRNFEERFHSRTLQGASLPYKSFSARKSSRGSSKLQLPNVVTNRRRSLSRWRSLFQSRQAKNSSPNWNELTFSSSSIAVVCAASHLCSAASTAAPSTLRKPCIFVFTSSRYWRSG